MKQVILVAFISLVSLHSVVAHRKVNISIYYESLCPVSKGFLAKQLPPVYKEFKDLIDIDFVPNGRATSSKKDNETEFTCVHGREECSLNKMHVCVLSLANDQTAKVNYVACQMLQPSYKPPTLCVQQSGLLFEKVQECLLSASTKLQVEAESKTKQLSAYSLLQAGHVPQIMFNHQYDVLKRDVALVNLHEVLCDEVSLLSNVSVPKTCQH